MRATLLRGERRTGAALAEILEGGIRRDFRFAVAYARASGAAILEKPLRQFISGGGAAQGIVGVNQGNTSYQGLALLADVIGDGLHLRCARKGGAIFHPKLYFFGDAAGEVAPASVVVGSSNLTRGGLQGNEECDALLENFSTRDDREFAESVGDFWEGLRVNSANFATIRANPDILKALLECGALVDENKSAKRAAATPKVIEEALSRILADAAVSQHGIFAMTLSGFDTSKRGADPVVLIPVSARDEDPRFWFWPDFFQREKKLLGMHLDSSVDMDGETHPEQVRLYDYPDKTEFRLKSEIVKRRGNKGDILVVRRNGDEMRLSVIRRDAPEHATCLRRLTNRVSPMKQYGYFNRMWRRGMRTGSSV